MLQAIKSFFKRKKNITQGNDLTFSESESLDLQFTKKFTHSGGKFFFCENDKKAIQFLVDICQNEAIDAIFTFDKPLANMVQVAGKEKSNDIQSADAVFMYCEHLIAFDGSIMVDSDQIGNLKISDLPNKIIIYSPIDKVVSSNSEGLENIRRNKKDNLPSNITCLRGKTVQDFTHTNHPKELYLLAIE